MRPQDDPTSEDTVRRRIARWYDHMDHTLHVMMDRSMWFAPMYETISIDHFAPLVARDPRLRGRERDLEEPVRFACGYAQTVFLCTAVEVFFIWHYGSSVAFFIDTGHGTLMELSTLRPWVESRKELKSWESWQHLTPAKRFRTLTALSFADLKVAESFFSDIYGSDCFTQALSKSESAKLATVYQELQSERNGIVHRGGEHKSGRRIEVPRSRLRDRYALGKWLGTRLLRMSGWFRTFWLGGYE